MWDSRKFIYLLCCFAAFLLVYCNQNSTHQNTPLQYLNLSDTVAYVGMSACKTCHANIHETFIHTGMGRSFDHATPEKSFASYGTHALVFDEKSNFYYKPFFKDSTLYITEFRLENGDTTHKRTEKISYIIGSGQHTNSHIIDENGYIFQAPITFYTQEKKWDMAPGFKTDNLRFDRLLTPECITCHNHLPKYVSGSLNKYESMPKGIECERCHGPGEVHVQQKKEGIIIDTSKYIDYSIVNPNDLSRDLQMDICQRCHLQGVAVLEEGKTFFDFKPGMKLSDVFNVFLPRYTNSHEQFIMASQADRLSESKCFTESEDLTCITCHNPHLSVENTNKSNYNNACNSCHKGTELSFCSVSKNELDEKGHNCVTCHMPRSGSIDIPHINITDHFISKKTAFKSASISSSKKNEIARFLGLKILTKEKATPLEMAKGYIAQFDKYSPQIQMLDSAKYYLDRSELPAKEKFKTLIHYYFSAEDYENIIKVVNEYVGINVTDGWTAYRIGEAFFKGGDPANALLYYKKATKAEPLNLDFQEKLGTTYISMQYLPQAMQTFEFILKENPKRKIAQGNLGYVKALMGKFDEAEKYYENAIALDPDYEQALLNKASLHFQKNEKPLSLKLLNRILKINPDNTQANLLKEMITK
jgi:tetratricopeptide (TPR) repeat protein